MNVIRIIFASTTKINQKANGNGRYIIRHDNSIIFIRNTSRRFVHKSVMAATEVHRFSEQGSAFTPTCKIA